MRIERHESVEAVVAILDEVEAKVLGRSAEALPRWMEERPPEARGALRWVRDGSTFLTASFRDEAALGAFLRRFMPGKFAADGHRPHLASETIAA